MRTRIAAAVLAAGLTLAGCSGSTSGTGAEAKPAGHTPTSKAPATGASEAREDVTITRSGWEDHPVWGPHAYVVHYKITNHGGKAADYFAQFQFLDADGDLLGSTGVTADQLGPGKTKKGDTSPLKAEIENGAPSDIKTVRVGEVDRT